MSNNAGSVLCCVLVVGAAVGAFVMAGRRRSGGIAGADSRSADYLSSAPPGQRKDVLAAVCLNRVAALPVAAAEEFGEPVTDTYGLQPAADVVRQTLHQDESMHAWVARTALIMLDYELSMGQAGWLDLLGDAVTSVGFVEGGRLRPDLADRLPPDVKERVEALHNWVMSIFWVVAQPQVEDEDRDRRLYEHLFESLDPRTRLTGFDITAYAGVMIGRMRNRGMLGLSKFNTDQYRNVPPLTEPGWYPNPYNYGDLHDGRPDFERYWDGNDWTDQSRHLIGGRWTESEHSLHSIPNN